MLEKKRMKYTCREIQNEILSIMAKAVLWKIISKFQSSFFTVMIDETTDISNTEQVVSLSTLVLNSRDWSEIIWLPEISRFKINLAISFIQKNPLECIG